jgi:hypothetical protein
VFCRYLSSKFALARIGKDNPLVQLVAAALVADSSAYLAALVVAVVHDFVQYQVRIGLDFRLHETLLYHHAAYMLLHDLRLQTELV